MISGFDIGALAQDFGDQRSTTADADFAEDAFEGLLDGVGADVE